MKYASVCSGVEAASLAWMPLGWKAAWFSEIEPFPCAVLKERFPNVPNLGDMTKIKVENLENGDQRFTNGTGTDVFVPGGVDLLVGGTPCFPAGTLVLTPEGYKPIETLKIGDNVISHLGNICKVSAVGSKVAPIGQLKIVGRPEIRCTSNHPFLTIDVKRDYRRTSPTYSQIVPCGEWDFTAAEKSVGKYAGRLEIRQSEYHIPQTNLTDNDLLELAGWYVGDGYIREFRGKSKKAIILALVSENKIRIFREHFEKKINFCIGSDGKITIYNTQIAEFLIDNFGKKADGKKVPYWLYSSDILKKAFLFGLEKTDGCDRGNSITITTISETLAYGVADLYQNASVRRQKVEPQKEIDGRTINQHDYYVISAYKHHTPKTKFINGRYASRVKEFKNGNGTVGTVYNITVDNDHTYIVNGIAVHNCQSFSVAGKREGLDGASGLARTFVQLLESMHPRWFVWENVPGCLSSRNKQTGVYDFNFLLAAFAEVGYTCGWRILDAQYTRVDGYPRAVPQRRRRVFVVGHLGGEWQYPAEVLFEPHSLSWNTPPRRVKGEGTAADVKRSVGNASKTFSSSCHGGYAAAAAGTLKSSGGDIGGGSENLATFRNGNQYAETLTCTSNNQLMPDMARLQCVVEGATAFNGAGMESGNLPLVQECYPINSMVLGKDIKEGDRQGTGIGKATDPSPTLGTSQHHAVAIAENIIGRQVQNGGNGISAQEELAYTQNTSGVMGVCSQGVDVYNHRETGDIATTLTANSGEPNTAGPKVMTSATVRRLLPIECERLMGFPDNHTRIAWKGKSEDDCPDSPRYKACGNSMCVNVMRWIGMRIENIERKVKTGE